MMALPVMVNMPGFQFSSYHDTMDAQAYTRDCFSMEMEPCLDVSQFEPSPREVDNSIAYYQDWSEPPQPWARPDSAYLVPFFEVQQYQKIFNRPCEATGPIPRPYEPARGSPTSSSCSSITSPAMDGEWCPDLYQHQAMMEGGALSRSASLSQALPELCCDSIPSTSYIKMSVVQGFLDPDVAEEYETDVDARTDFPVDTQGRTIRMEKKQEQYRRSSEEGVGLSLKNADTSSSAELSRSEPAMTEDAEGDVDAEGEDVNEFDETLHETEEAAEEVEEEDQDTEYKPKAPRGKRRRPSRASSSPSSGKKNKVTKASSSSSRKFPSRLQCKSCDYHTKDATALTQHVISQHTRPYVCTFSFAGCMSTFVNKNEWKRHVSSQHLGLQYWKCSEGTCSPSKSNSPIRDANHSRVKQLMNVFNRKDLFTQHLKRMHAPAGIKQGKKNLAWDERVKELQSSCLVIKREPPSKTKCPVRSCGHIFEGPTSWDDQMEHVGRHLEKGTASTHGDITNNDIEQETDEFMIQWALKERIVERHGSGYRFCPSAVDE